MPCATWRLRVVWLAVFLVALTLAAMARPTLVNAAVVYNEQIRFQDDFDGCSGERILVDGTQHIVGRVSQDATGRLHFGFTRNTYGKGIGYTSGDQYILTDTVTRASVEVVTVGAQTYTERYHARLIRRGETVAGDDTLVHFLKKDHAQRQWRCDRIRRDPKRYLRVDFRRSARINSVRKRSEVRMIADVIVKAAGRKGQGVFAIRDLSPRLFSADAMVVIVRNDEIETLSTDDQRHLCELDWDRSAVLRSPGCYLNHACDPNAMRKGVKVFAWKPIHAGEEVTIDYRLNAFTSERWDCVCGSANCQGTVTSSFFTLSEAQQAAYLPYAPTFIQREYQHRHSQLQPKRQQA